MEYTPHQGDLIYMDFSPQSGHEQRGRRPALVISNDEFFRRTHLALVCPVTSTDNGFPLHIPLMGCEKLKGFILTEHVKCQDVISRDAEFVERVSQEILDEVTDMILAFVE